MMNIFIALTIALAVPLNAHAQSSPPPDAGALVIAAGIDIGSGSAIIAGSGSGSSSVPVVVINPAQPVQSIESAWSAEKQFGVIWGSMLVLFGIGTVIVKKNDETHWLSQDHTLPIAVGVLGTIGAAINAKFAGGSWAVALTTLMTVVTLVLQKPQPGKSSSTPAAPVKA